MRIRLPVAVVLKLSVPHVLQVLVSISNTLPHVTSLKLNNLLTAPHNHMLALNTQPRPFQQVKKLVSASRRSPARRGAAQWPPVRPCTLVTACIHACMGAAARHGGGSSLCFPSSQHLPSRGLGSGQDAGGLHEWSHCAWAMGRRTVWPLWCGMMPGGVPQDVKLRAWDQLQYVSALTGLTDLTLRHAMWNIPELACLAGLTKLTALTFEVG